MLPLSDALGKEEVLPPGDSTPLAELAGAHALQQADMHVGSMGCNRAGELVCDSHHALHTDGARCSAGRSHHAAASSGCVA